MSLYVVKLHLNMQKSLISWTMLEQREHIQIQKWLYVMTRIIYMLTTLHLTQWPTAHIPTVMTLYITMMQSKCSYKIQLIAIFLIIIMNSNFPQKMSYSQLKFSIKTLIAPSFQVLQLTVLKLELFNTHKLTEINGQFKYKYQLLSF